MTTSELINLTITNVDSKSLRLNIMCNDEAGNEFWCIGSLNLDIYSNLKVGDFIRVNGSWVISPDGERTVFFIENILDL